MKTTALFSKSVKLYFYRVFTLYIIGTLICQITFTERVSGIFPRLLRRIFRAPVLKIILTPSFLFGSCYLSRTFVAKLSCPVATPSCLPLATARVYAMHIQLRPLIQFSKRDQFDTYVNLWKFMELTERKSSSVQRGHCTNTNSRTF